MPTRATSSPDPYLNQLLSSRYRLLRLLGQGAMGRVYLAQDQQLGGVTVAIKVLSQALVDPEARLRFEREAQACAYLGQKSLHIVRVNDYGLTDARVPFYVMEYLNGRTLREIVRAGPLPLSQFYLLARQLSIGLKAAHEGIRMEGHTVQVVHRDLKPGNVIVVADDSLGELAKIVDFGIAKLLSETGSFSVTHAYMGTLAYSSPEQLEGLPLDGRSDLYSLGIILYEMVTGTLPIMPDTDSFPAWYHAHLKRQPRRFDPRQLTVPEGLESLILRCLQKHPDDRPQSAAEVIAALDQIGQGRRLATSSPPVPTVNDPTQTVGTFRLGDNRQEDRWEELPSWWERLIPLAVGGLLGVGSFAFGWHWLQGQFATSPTAGSDPVEQVDSALDTPLPQISPTPVEAGTSREERPSDPQQLASGDASLAPAVQRSEPPPISSSRSELPIFPVSTPRVSVRSQLGQPQESGTGFWPNTVYDLYRRSVPGGGPMDLGLIYDRSTLALRQTEATVTDQMPEDLVIQILVSMLQADPPQQIRSGLQQVRARVRDQFRFQFEILEGTIERNAQGRIYIATWEPDLHRGSSSGVEVNLQFDLDPGSLFGDPNVAPGETLQRIRQEKRERD